MATVVGGAAGFIGAALILPAATAAGTGMALATGSSAIGLGTDLVLGGWMAGTANVLLSNTQRVATDVVNGEKVRANGVWDDFYTNYPKDMFYGALGYGIGRGLHGLAGKFWKPSEVIGNPKVSDPYGGIGSLLNPNPSQKAIAGAAQAGAEALSNSTLLQHTFQEKKMLRIDEMLSR